MSHPTDRITAAQHPQHGPALALAALLTEHPELPPLHWSITDDGVLRGSGHGPDQRGTIGAYVTVLGGTPLPPSLFNFQHRQLVSEVLFTTWRDIPVTLALTSSIKEYPELREERAA